MTPEQQHDPHDLNRFVAAQESCYATVITELKNGDKQTHWMWFVFPQIDGLGTSPTAKRYAIKTMAEATAYLQHPLLGPRLLECSRLLLQVHGKTAYEILGSPDDAKLQSCMTLFSIVAPDEPVFKDVLERYYVNKKDERTLTIVNENI